jgi:hypothetical protein
MNLLLPVCLSSADWQSAVSRIVNPQAVRTSKTPSFAGRRTMILLLLGEKAGMRADVPPPIGTDFFGSLAAM